VNRSPKSWWRGIRSLGRGFFHPAPRPRGLPKATKAARASRCSLMQVRVVPLPLTATAAYPIDLTLEILFRRERR
jgi:hypothetical protein